MITIDKVTKNYGRQVALSDIELELKKGECIALIGPNGSGKTTLIKTILRLVFPDSGNIFFNGDNIKANAEYRKHIGYMPQMSQLPENMTVKQLFQMIKSIREDTKVDKYDNELYQQFEIEKMEYKPLRTLSGGMRQKVSAALAFLFNPDVLILDEPTAALDPVANENLKRKIYVAKEENKLILITSHNLNDLEGLVNRIIFMMDGKILFRDSLDALASETNETQLNKMIVKKLKDQGKTWEN